TPGGSPSRKPRVARRRLFLCLSDGRAAGHRLLPLLSHARSAESPLRESGRIAQLVEQLTLNQRVQGSSPCAPTIKSSTQPISSCRFDKTSPAHFDKFPPFVLASSLLRAPSRRCFIVCLA